MNGDTKLFSYPFGQPESCYNFETDKTLRDLGIKKIFYANILENKSFNQNSFYRIATEKRFNLGYMKFISIFRPFFNQLISNYKKRIKY